MVIDCVQNRREDINCSAVAVLARNIWGARPPPDGERGSASL